METDIFTPRKVAELMLLLKMARIINSPTEDSYVDAIGYAAIAGELAGIEVDAEKKAEEAYNSLSPERQLSSDQWSNGNGFWEVKK